MLYIESLKYLYKAAVATYVSSGYVPVFFCLWITKGVWWHEVSSWMPPVMQEEAWLLYDFI